MEIIPYFPSIREMRRRIAARLSYSADMKPRDLTRTLIAGAHGQSPLRLSVPIEGGSSVVKRGHPDIWHLSDHGRWRRMHLGAIEAAYGSTPYFIHLFPLIEEIFEEFSSLRLFTDFTARLHQATLDFIQFDTLLPSLEKLRNDKPDFLNTLIQEKRIDEIDDFAFIDVIFKKGSDSIFQILD